MYTMSNWFGQVFHDDWGVRRTAESPEFFPPNGGSGTLNRNRFFLLITRNVFSLDRPLRPTSWKSKTRKVLRTRTYE